MAFRVDLFQAALKFGGAAPSTFQVNITNPVNGIGDISVPFLTRAANLPGSNLGQITQFYFGRQVKLAGNRTYEDWTTTILNDEDFLIRNALEEWSHAINGPESNLRNLNSASPVLYKSQAQVTQFSKTGAPVRVYDFVGIWPQVISPIDLSWEAEGIQEYQVTWAVDYWKVSGGVTGNAGGN